MAAAGGPGRRGRALLAAFLVATVGIGAWYAVTLHVRTDLVSDEYYHVPAIRALAQGDWGPVRGLPVMPTYHWLASWLVRLWGPELWVIRLLNPLLGAITLLLFVAALRARSVNAGANDLLRLAWQPLLLPFWVFAYTEVGSLLGVVAALNFHCRRRYTAAAGGLLAACLFRQSSVAWVPLFAALGALDLWAAQSEHVAATRQNLRRFIVRRALPSLWAYGVLLVVAAAFFIVIGGLTTTFKPENQPRPNIAQVHGLVLTAALIWAPIWLVQFVDFWRRVYERALLRPAVCAAVFAAIGLLVLSYSNRNPWNMDLHFLRNWPLHAMTRCMETRYLSALVIVAAVPTFVCALRESPARRTLSLVWMFMLLYLFPHWLVDPRYYLVPFVLVDFYTPYTPAQARRLTIWYALLTLGVAAFILGRPGGWQGIW